MHGKVLPIIGALMPENLRGSRMTAVLHSAKLISLQRSTFAAPCQDEHPFTWECQAFTVSTYDCFTSSRSASVLI